MQFLSLVLYKASTVVLKINQGESRVIATLFMKVIGLRVGKASLSKISESTRKNWEHPIPSPKEWWALNRITPIPSLNLGIKKNLNWTVSSGSLIVCYWHMKSESSFSVWILSILTTTLLFFSFHSFSPIFWNQYLPNIWTTLLRHLWTPADF